MQVNAGCHRRCDPKSQNPISATEQSSGILKG